MSAATNAIPKNRRTPNGLHVAQRVLVYALLIAFGAVVALPFFWLVSTSLKAPGQLFKLPIEWIPNPFMWSNYPRATTYIPFFTYFGNTLYIAGFNVIANVISSSLVAYGFSRINWPGRNAVFIVLVSTLILPFAVTLIPTFIVFRNLGWIGTPNPLTIPALTANAFHVFLLRQFFMTIPQELSQAAKIDGASEFQIYWRLILPLAKPALAVVALFTFIGSWNDFLGPLIYLTKKETFTLSLGLYGFLTRSGNQWGLLMAAVTIMISPIILLFFLAQRTFIEGITLTGIKG